jgi:UDP-N-acetylmuramoylalanine--D-glutamate ligase
LIAGGHDKGASYKPWIEAFQGKVKRMVVFGEAKEKMERELGHALLVDRTETLDQALQIARSFAKEFDTILFSPGCSSYDQFQNYEERGDTFKRLVRG